MTKLEHAGIGTIVIVVGTLAALGIWGLPEPKPAARPTLPVSGEQFPASSGDVIAAGGGGGLKPVPAGRLPAASGEIYGTETVLKRLADNSGSIRLRPAPDVSVIDIKDVPENGPRFERVYTTALAGGVNLKVDLESSWSFRTGFGQIARPSGPWIIFVPDQPAGRVPADLLPRVQPILDLILAADKDFMASKPSRFLDETGAAWIREPKPGRTKTPMCLFADDVDAGVPSWRPCDGGGK